MCSRFGPRVCKTGVILAAFALVLVFYAGCRAAGVEVIAANGRKINLAAGKSVIIRSAVPIIRVSSANDKVATVTVLSPEQVYVVGKAVGATNITLWRSQYKIAAVYNVVVEPDIARIREKLHQLFPAERGLRVTAGNDSVTLAGTVSSAPVMLQIIALAKEYTRGKPVINMVRVSGVQQVMLQVRVAEMDRSLTKRLSLDFVLTTAGSFGTSMLGGLGAISNALASSALNPTVAPATNALFHIAGGSVSWTQFIDALKQDGLVKLLAEPTLMAMSGQTASFLAGGEFPVPVPQGLGTVAIEYKKYGVQLNFTPFVLDNDKISMKVAPSVSELDFNNGTTINGTAVPALTTRGASTMIELHDGQSFAIAGLLQDNITETIAKFPGLGNMPVLGPLFRSNSFQRNQTELVIIVTPHLVKPLNLKHQALPTDNYTEPSDTDFYLRGLLQGCETATPPPICQKPDEELPGEFGHALPK